jgi:DNA polymerase III subunit gamma/tau
MAEQSQTLYRKWRSQTFADLVGQDAVVRTLRQAVAQHRLTHAYLFCGPRGTGKTSMARLLAKMVNCANPRDGEPCNVCDSCQEITEGRSTDVFEIDAASNRGIDEIRDLRERVRVIAATGRTRIFTIDEVHMLTTEAFNALLKTLEEPPPRVIFILATTEAYKVPATVVSRCQRFDFRRIDLRAIVARLQYVCAEEQMQVEPAALETIARAAQGGMRDALSLLDQARAFSGDAITAEAIRAMLGQADPAMLRDLVVYVAENDTGAGLHRINELALAGMDLRQMASQMAELWRQLMLARAGANITELLELSTEDATDLTTLAARFPLEVLMECAATFARNDAGARVQVVPQLALELAFLECVAAMHRPTLSTVPASAPPREDSPPSRPAAGLREDAAPFPTRSAPAPRPEPPPPVAATPPQLSSTIRDAAPTPPNGASPQPVSGTADTIALLDLLSRQWGTVITVCRQRRSEASAAASKAAALLQNARPVAIRPGAPLTVILAMQFAAHIPKLQQPDVRAIAEWAIQQIIEHPCSVLLIQESEAAAYGAAPVSPESPPAPRRATSAPPAPVETPPISSSAPAVAPVPDAAPPSDPRSLAARDPLVQALQQEFNAQITDIRRLEEP